MKNLLLAVLVLALIVSLGNTSAAQGKMRLSVGGDVLLPMGDWKEGHNMGFGGSARFQYNITPLFSAGATAGYYTWGGKDPVPNFKGIPVRVFGKYYFMPEGAARFYGIFEAGLFFGSSGDVTITTPGFTLPNGQVIGGGTTTVSGGSTTDFNYAPGVGVELPLSGGKTLIDLSVRWDGIAASGGSANSVGARAAVSFALGN